MEGTRRRGGAAVAAASAVALLACSLAGCRAEGTRLEKPRCEYRVDPLGVDVEAPRLSWILSSGRSGARQTAYEVLAASTPEKLGAGVGDLWTTGRVPSDRTAQIEYAGRPLRSRERVHWKARAFDERGEPTPWSAPASFTMGLLAPLDWTARWIGAPPSAAPAPDPYVTVLLRREFTVEKPLRRALCFVSGLGQYELELDGEKVGEEWLAPGWTQYAKSVLYDVHEWSEPRELAERLAPGRHCLALRLGNGMYHMAGDTRGSQQLNSLGRPCAILQLELEAAEEEDARGAAGAAATPAVATIESDESWRVAPGPTSYSGVFGGEDWDARLDPVGWSRVGFDDSGWVGATVVKGPGGTLRGVTHAAPPLLEMESRAPVRVTSPKPGVRLFDLGQNAPYVPKVVVAGPAGATVKVWPAEILKPDGTIDQATMRPGKHASYTLRGDGRGGASTREAPETWWPRFWYCGSRFWQAEATDAAGAPIDVGELLLEFRGLRVHSSSPEVGSFECSDPLFNAVERIIVAAMRANMASVLTDCPHREKAGWLEQDHLMGPGLLYCFDVAALLDKTVHDVADTQRADGMVATMAPEYFFYEKGFRDSVEWGAACVFVPDLLRTWLGDERVVRESAGTMRRWVDYLSTQAKDGILSSGLGDWDGNGADPRTPVGVTDTAWWYASARTTAALLRSIGDGEAAAAMDELAARVRADFRMAFVDLATGKVDGGSQSSQATALDLGLIDPGEEGEQAFALLLADLEKQGFAVSCGEVGHLSLLRTLAAHGRSDLIWRLHHQSERPGYGFQVARGATTLTETWNASPISHDHFMLGHILEWFHGQVAGIRPDPAAPGFRHFFVQPTPVGDLAWARASYDSIAGLVESSWRRVGERFELDVTIPANTSATIRWPEGFALPRGASSREIELASGRHRLR
jgi:hypothetical protein